MDRKWEEKDPEKRGSDGSVFVCGCVILGRGLNAGLCNRGQHISQRCDETGSILTLTKRTHAPTDSKSPRVELNSTWTRKVNPEE